MVEEAGEETPVQDLATVLVEVGGGTRVGLDGLSDPIGVCGPGEIGGPALAITVKVKNQTGKKLDLALGVVNAYYGSERTPAVSVASDGEVPFPASVADGESAKGVYIFQIPEEARPVRVELDLGNGADVVVFKGRPQR